MEEAVYCVKSLGFTFQQIIHHGSTYFSDLRVIPVICEPRYLLWNRSNHELGNFPPLWRCEYSLTFNIWKWILDRYNGPQFEGMLLQFITCHHGCHDAWHIEFLVLSETIISFINGNELKEIGFSGNLSPPPSVVNTWFVSLCLSNLKMNIHGIVCVCGRMRNFHVSPKVEQQKPE